MQDLQKAALVSPTSKHFHKTKDNHAMCLNSNVRTCQLFLTAVEQVAHVAHVALRALLEYMCTLLSMEQ